MKANSDCFFSIGQHHVSAGLPCQDYALTCEGQKPGSQLAVISDGCSGSLDTDIGARFLCQMLKAKFQTYERIVGANGVIGNLNSFCKDMNISKTCLDASLCWIMYTPKQSLLDDINVTITGDGSFFVQYRDGASKFVYVDWEANTPPYLNYCYNEERRKGLLSSGQKGSVTSIYKDMFGKPTEVTNFVSMEEALLEDITFTYSSRDIQFVSVMSDGMGQFDKSPLYHTVQQFNNFKLYSGSFVKRRSIRALRDLALEACRPFDDVSIATIHFDSRV